VKSILVKQHPLILKRNNLKFSIKVTLKKDVLDPQGKVVQQTLQNMGMSTLKSLRQGKYFEIEIDENNEDKAKNKIEDICKKLLVNLIIEDFEISKI
jgi:phosphoribosylformylglycinamidine synthase PurS subunit